MLEFLTGTGLAAAAGLNAWIPLLVLGLLDRFTPLVALPPGWAWLSDGWVLVILGVLLVIEVVADKVPGLDSVNDVVQTVVRPTAGGIAFGSGAASETVTVTDPAAFAASSQWVPVLIGIVIALAVHLAKALVRPAANLATAGIAAPVVSAVEDVSSVALALLAIVVPVLAVLALAGGIVAAVIAARRLRRRRAARGADVGAGDAAPGAGSSSVR